MVGRKNHRFPNLACMKISMFHKQQGDQVNLLMGYKDISDYDKVYISKVFTDTEVPDGVLGRSNVEYGGTGFFYDKASPLSHEIEHSFPDYELYKEWVEQQIASGIKRKLLEYYLDFSIGFTTRGCFRGCEFCVNKNSKGSFTHSGLSEFIASNRKYICLQDDNIFACKDWKAIFEELQQTGKPFVYRQGLDERLLTEEKSIMLSKSKWIGDVIFAFDNIKDKDMIIEKLKLYKKHNKRQAKFYVFTGFDRDNKWNYDFWVNDIREAFERLKILMQHQTLPYLTRYSECKSSPFAGTYINLARWCNQPNFFKKKSYREFCIANQSDNMKSECATIKYMKELEEKHPEIAKEYFDMKYSDYVWTDKREI